MVNLDNLEYSYLDEAIAELQIGPDEAELVIPGFILRDREKELVYWKDQMRTAQEKLEQTALEVKQ